jgi:hypothetical protein
MRVWLKMYYKMMPSQTKAAKVMCIVATFSCERALKCLGVLQIFGIHVFSESVLYDFPYRFILHINSLLTSVP